MLWLQESVHNHECHSSRELCRIGRTGRAGAAGLAFSFFTAANARLAKPIQTLLEEGSSPVPAQLAKYADITGGFAGGGTLS